MKAFLKIMAGLFFLVALAWLNQIFFEKPIMEEYFGLKLPPDFQSVPAPPGENADGYHPRLHYRITPAQFTQLTGLLGPAGYSSWVQANRPHGTAEQNSLPADPLFYCEKKRGEMKLMFFYQPSTGLLDAVTGS